MFVHYRTQGIILKKENKSEADQLFTVYTKDFGKLEILGKGIRKISSKLRSGADLFYLSEIEFIQGKIYKTLTDAILIEKFENIQKSLIKFKFAYEISQILDKLIIEEGEKDEKIWELTKEVFNKLNNWQIKNSLKIENCKLEILYYYFFWNLVSLLGYQPELQNCTIQGKKTNCDVIKIIKVILRKDWQLLIKLRLEPKHFKLLKNLSQWYIRNIVEI